MNKLTGPDKEKIRNRIENLEFSQAVEELERMGFRMDGAKEALQKATEATSYEERFYLQGLVIFLIGQNLEGWTENVTKHRQNNPWIHPVCT